MPFYKDKPANQRCLLTAENCLYKLFRKASCALIAPGSNKPEIMTSFQIYHSLSQRLM